MFLPYVQPNTRYSDDIQPVNYREWGGSSRIKAVIVTLVFAASHHSRRLFCIKLCHRVTTQIFLKLLHNQKLKPNQTVLSLLDICATMHSAHIAELQSFSRALETVFVQQGEEALSAKYWSFITHVGPFSLKKRKFSTNTSFSNTLINRLSNAFWKYLQHVLRNNGSHCHFIVFCQSSLRTSFLHHTLPSGKSSNISTDYG